MAIAFESAAGPLTTSPGTTHTVCSRSHTVPAGNNRFMVVGVRFSSGAGLASATYAGVAMTRLFGASGFSQFFYLIGPATGANTLEFTHGSENAQHDFFVSIYSGVDQSGIKGSAESSDATSPADVTVTPDVSNAWIIVFVRANSSNTAMTPNANTTNRVSTPNDGRSDGIGDTGTTVSVATLVGYDITSEANNFRAHALAVGTAVAGGTSAVGAMRGLSAAQGILP